MYLNIHNVKRLFMNFILLIHPCIQLAWGVNCKYELVVGFWV